MPRVEPTQDEVRDSSQKKLRTYDVDSDGKIDEQEMMHMERARLRERNILRAVIAVAVVVALFATLASMGLAYGVAVLSREVAVDSSTGVLVNAANNQPVVTRDKPIRQGRRQHSTRRSSTRRRGLLQTEDTELNSVGQVDCTERDSTISDLTLGVFEADGLLEIDGVNKTMYVKADEFVVTGSNMYVQFRFPASSSNGDIDPNDDYTLFLGDETESCDSDTYYDIVQGSFSDLTGSTRRSLLAEGASAFVAGPIFLEVWNGLPLEDGITVRRQLTSSEMLIENPHAPDEQHIGHSHLSLSCDAAKDVFQAVLSGVSDVKAQVDLADLDNQHLLNVRLMHLKLASVDADGAAQRVSGLAVYRTWELTVAQEPFTLHCPAGFAKAVEAGSLQPASCACFLSLDNAARGASLGALSLRRQLLSSSANSPGSASHENGASSSCFPADAAVVLEPMQPGGPPVHKLLSDVELGDRILSVDPSTGATSYQDVFLRLHHDDDSNEIFYHLETEYGATLRLSPTHYVYVSKSGTTNTFASARPVPARAVAVDDVVWIAEPGQASTFQTRVTRVFMDIHTGLYNVHTLSGVLVVDGVVASQYLETSLFPGVVQSSLPPQHTLFAPLRLLWRVCPSCIKALHGPEYTRLVENGLHHTLGCSLDDVFQATASLGKFFSVTSS